MTRQDKARIPDYRITTTKELRKRIELALEELPFNKGKKPLLNKARKKKAAAALTKKMGFILSCNGYLDSRSHIFDFSGKLRGGAEAFSAEGLTLKAYLKAALRGVPLFYQSAAVVEPRIRGVVAAFAGEGLTIERYLKAALEQPSLFYQDPETIETNIRCLVTEFAKYGLTVERYLEAALDHPSLFSTPAKTVADHVDDIVKEFSKYGFTEKALLTAALRQSTLFNTSLGVARNSINGVVAEFKELTTEDYLAAALKQPQLFFQDPDTINRHIHKIIDLYKEGKIELGPEYEKQESSEDLKPLFKHLVNRPVSLCLADSNYELRGVYGDIRLKMRAAGREAGRRLNVLRTDRNEMEKSVAAHYEHFDMKKPVRPSNKKLYELVKSGLIKSLKLAV